MSCGLKWLLAVHELSWATVSVNIYKQVTEIMKYQFSMAESLWYFIYVVSESLILHCGKSVLEDPTSTTANITCKYSMEKNTVLNMSTTYD
jgi:hypothetical protein